MKRKLNSIDIECSWSRYRKRDFGTTRNTDYLLIRRLIRLGKITIIIVKDYDLNPEEDYDL